MCVQRKFPGTRLLTAWLKLCLPKRRRLHRPSPSLPKPNSVEVPHLLLITVEERKKVKCSIFKPAANHTSPKAPSQVILLFIPHWPHFTSAKIEGSYLEKLEVIFILGTIISGYSDELRVSVHTFLNSSVETAENKNKHENYQAWLDHS